MISNLRNFNVGIGLTGPGEKLSVAGNVMIGDATWAAGTTTGDLAIQGNLGIGTASPSGKLEVNGSTYIMSGNVGIGTTSPGTAMRKVKMGGQEGDKCLHLKR